MTYNIDKPNKCALTLILPNLSGTILIQLAIFFIDLTSVISQSSGVFQPLWLYLVTFLHRSIVFSQIFHVNAAQDSYKRVSFSLSTPSPGNLIHSHPFNHSLYSYSSHIHISSPQCFPELQHYMPRCLLVILSRRFYRHHKFDMYQSELINFLPNPVLISEKSTTICQVPIRKQGIIISYFLSHIYKLLSYAVDFIT